MACPILRSSRLLHRSSAFSARYGYQSQDTSLAVVAPGIAEALAATAYGLAAAIPASVGYNCIGAAFARTGQQVAHNIENEALSLATGHAAAASRSSDSKVSKFKARLLHCIFVVQIPLPLIGIGWPFPMPKTFASNHESIRMIIF